MSTANDPKPNDELLDEVQRKVDEVRAHLHDTPGTTVMDRSDLPPHLRDELDREHVKTTEFDGTGLADPES